MELVASLGSKESYGGRQAGGGGFSSSLSSSEEEFRIETEEGTTAKDG